MELLDSLASLAEYTRQYLKPMIREEKALSLYSLLKFSFSGICGHAIKELSVGHECIKIGGSFTSSTSTTMGIRARSPPESLTATINP